MTLEICYKSKRLEKICTNYDVAVKTYNEKMAIKIATRISQIEAADSTDTLLQYQIGRCHNLKGNRKNQLAMDLVQPFRLIFVGIDVDKVEIIEIVDYH